MDKLDLILQELAGLKADMQQMKTDILNESNQNMKVLLDAEVKPRFNLLAENQDHILRCIPTEEDEELWNTRIAAIEAVVKKHSREIAALKKAN